MVSSLRYDIISVFEDKSREQTNQPRVGKTPQPKTPPNNSKQCRTIKYGSDQFKTAQIDYPLGQVVV